MAHMSAVTPSDIRAHAKSTSYQGLLSAVTSPPKETAALGGSSARTDI